MVGRFLLIDSDENLGWPTQTVTQTVYDKR